MLYTGERNYGCRFMEVTLFGLRTIILENEKIRVMFLLDKGTEIIEFNYKKTDTDFVWRSPQGLSRLYSTRLAGKDEQQLTDNYTGGWFEAFPSLRGSGTDYKGARLPTYGEVCYLPWEYSVTTDEPGEVSLRCFVRTVKTPFRLEKTFIIKSNIPSLFIEESIVNLGNERMEYEWGYHPNFGSPFLDESCIIDLPGGNLDVFEPIDTSRVDVNAKGAWPILMGKDGKPVDFSRVMPADKGVMDLLYLSDIKDGWAAVRNTSKGVGIGLSWDAATFGNCMLWMVANGDTGYPRYGDTYVLCIFPRNIKGAASLGSRNDGSANIIQKGDVLRTWLTVTAFEDEGKVMGIGKDGSVCLES